MKLLFLNLGSLRLSDSSFSLTNRLSEASDTTFTVANGVVDAAPGGGAGQILAQPNPNSVISNNELSRSQIMAVQAPHDDQESSFDPPSKNAFHPKKVHATSASNSNSSPNDLNHNGLNKNLSSSSPTTPASQQEAEESFESAVTTEQEQ